MSTPTLIVTLPDGTTATRTTPRAYVSAVVFRCTEAEAEAAEAELARYQATERGHHPLRDLRIVPVTEAPAKAAKARK
jgi:hypothetical protein